MSTLKMGRAACAIFTSMLLAAAPLAAAQASSVDDAELLCGGDKGGKDVKKPKGDEDEKRPTNPASL